jgi:hypothetical protein
MRKMYILLLQLVLHVICSVLTTFVCIMCCGYIHRYEELAREIEDTVVLALNNGEKFDEIAKKTRARFESNRPRAILFEGPPGTGKVLPLSCIWWFYFYDI